jgi:hypothetical protein
MKRLFLMAIMLGLAVSSAMAQSEEVAQRKTEKESSGMQTKQRFMPTRKRIDREINKNIFAYKGELALGLTASYGTLSSDNSDIFAILEQVNLSGYVTTVSPFISYFVADNMSVGVRLGYTHMGGTMDNMDLNLGSQNDVDISIPWLSVGNNTVRMSAFLRNYASIDQAGRFGVFSEIEASYAFGSNSFGFRTGDAEPNYTDSKNMTVKLWFNPGLAVYMFPNVCATISFGMGGFKYTSVKQYDKDGNLTGTRDTSKLRFRLNLADIKFGLNIHLWNKNKKTKR